MKNSNLLLCFCYSKLLYLKFAEASVGYYQSVMNIDVNVIPYSSKLQIFSIIFKNSYYHLCVVSKFRAIPEQFL